MNYEKINAAARELQELVAQAIKEEMPEQSKFVSNIFYVGNVQVFDDGTITLPFITATNELIEQAARLKLAVIEKERLDAEAKLAEIEERRNKCIKRFYSSLYNEKRG